MARTSQNSSHKPLEEYVSGVELQGGIYSNYPEVINNSITCNSLDVKGNVTVTGSFIGATASVNSLTTNTTLTATDSGNVYLLDSATGVTVTLPTAAVGLTYTFVVQTSVTSNSYKITVGSSNGFLIGGLVEGASAGATDLFIGDGTTDISVTMNGTTTGGLQGTRVTVTCVTTGLWEVSGTVIGSGTVATPFATT